jgi:POTRA domain, FtsQ-type
MTMWSKKKPTFREELYLPKRKQKKPKRSENVEAVGRKTPLLTVFLWLVFCGTAVYMLFLSSVMRMEILHVEGNTRVPKGRIEELFVNESEARLFTGIRRSNFFLFRTSRVQTILEQEFPAIEELSVSKTFPNKVNVILRERELAILWCSRGPCYLLSEQNVARAGDWVSERRGELPLYTVIDTGGLPVEIGRTLFDYPFVEHFKQNKERLEVELGIVIKPEMTSASRFSDELRMQTEGGWELLINSRIQPEENIKTLRLFFEQEVPFEKQGDLRNVDLRTENRIYYSLKNTPPKEEDEENKEGETTNRETKPVEETGQKKKKN